MYKVQNLTNRPVKFQDKIIEAYGTETFPQFTDFISLSRLSNSGKIRYFAVPTPVEKPVEIKEEIKKEIKEEVKAEPVKVEEPVVETVEVETPIEEKTETVEVEKADKFTANKKGRNKRKLED